ncbi:MAG: lactate utilization protein C [Alphaproteobacteria bacterium]|nr:lactate utilization protein C [Alphaproteobacteria bacterium]
MSDARDQILATIRRARGGNGDAAFHAVAEQRLQLKARGTIPKRVDRGPAALVDLFVEQALTLSATVDRVASPDAVPAAVAEYLARENLPATLRAAPSPEIEAIPWRDRPALTVTFGRSDGHDEVGLTPAFAAVAETGTLMLRSGPDHPTTLNFLPDTHVVVLRASRIVGPYEEGWAMLRAAGAMPRAVNFVSGPSRTADIEQTIQLGAHGPRRLHIVLIEDGDAR